jgi:hypothetical protein
MRRIAANIAKLPELFRKPKAETAKHIVEYITVSEVVIMVITAISSWMFFVL